MLRVLTAVLLISLAACAAPAPPRPAMVALGTSGDFGYSSKDLGPDRVEVTYRGDAVLVDVSNPREDVRTKMELDKAHDLALWRAAQIAQERGQAAFKIDNERRNSDIEVQRRTYYRPSPFYDPFWDPYDDPFWPGRRHRAFLYGGYGGPFPYTQQQVRSATARAEITLTVTFYPEYDPKAEDVLSTADTLAKLQATRAGAVY
ncbi:CC0125/CC1285 family lipoprotein [Dongia sp.]|uniref:CC0125/CC1285 family lipoprotein n=1 Tax=Dongia sp. TaxID=1977262 RepID=UPI003751EF2E